MPEFQINYLAVGGAALAPFVIGALWYSPLLFGKLWMKAHGYSEEKLEEMRKTAGRAYVVSLGIDSIGGASEIQRRLASRDG